MIKQIINVILKIINSLFSKTEKYNNEKDLPWNEDKNYKENEDIKIPWDENKNYNNLNNSDKINKTMKKKENKYVWLLCAGHGGIVDGKYTTAPNFDKNKPDTWYKSYYHESIDLSFFEGEFNREIKDMLIHELEENGIDFIDVVPENQDISLAERVEREHSHFIENDKKTIWLELHSNAGGGTGTEIFTTRGQNNSDYVAEAIIDEYKNQFPNQASREDLTDGDKDKEVDFYIIRKTYSPAVLVENFFFDNLKDVKLITSKEGKEKIVKALLNGILKVEEYGIEGLKEKYSF